MAKNTQFLRSQLMRNHVIRLTNTDMYFFPTFTTLIHRTTQHAERTAETDKKYTRSLETRCHTANNQ